MGREREEWRERGMNRWREGGRRGITVKGGREWIKVKNEQTEERREGGRE